MFGRLREPPAHHHGVGAHRTRALDHQASVAEVGRPVKRTQRRPSAGDPRSRRVCRGRVCRSSRQVRDDRTPCLFSLSAHAFHRRSKAHALHASAHTRRCGCELFMHLIKHTPQHRLAQTSNFISMRVLLNLCVRTLSCSTFVSHFVFNLVAGTLTKSLLFHSAVFSHALTPRLATTVTTPAATSAPSVELRSSSTLTAQVTRFRSTVAAVKVCSLSHHISLSTSYAISLTSWLSACPALPRGPCYNESV